MLPFTARRKADGAVVGMTTYMNVDAANRRVEIGSTWNARSAQGTGTNAECKLLLLGHAFETLDCIAVEFRTHWLNHQSRAAIAGWAPSRTACCATTRCQGRHPPRHRGVLDHRQRVARRPQRTTPVDWRPLHHGHFE